MIKTKHGERPRVRIIDKDALLAVDHVTLAEFVEHAGWRDSGGFGRYARVYERPNDEGIEIIVPFDSSIADYAARISDALRVLAENLEGHDELSIYEAITGEPT